jgi:phosphatidylglycerol:prolipoprotein diacylglycerol transferase
MFVHNIDPALATIGPLEIRWYGLMYVIGFILAYFIMKKISSLKKEDIENVLVYAGISGIIFARLFYVFIYNASFYLANPLEIFAVWHGGLSFHGGLVGALFGIYLFSKKHKKNFLELLDIMSIPFALALGLGRIGNFINGELYGRITNVPWCVNFQDAEGCRHPSQIYESLYSFLIFGILWFLKDKKRNQGMLAAVFIILYAVFRFVTEFFRMPDPQLGFIALGLSMGQILSILMFILGIFLYAKVIKQ